MAAEPYFDTRQASDDLKLLPSHLRRDENLETLVDVVTADIVARYTLSSFEAPAYTWVDAGWDGGYTLDGGELSGLVKLTDYLYVRLRGYAPDAANAEPYFRDAMRREVAQVLRWRLGQIKRDPAVESESDGETSKSYGEGHGEPFPPAFPMYLRPFVLVEGSWSL